MKLSRITKISILLASFFALDKVLGIVRQALTTRLFGGFTSELDAYNAANNIPDMLVVLLSIGGLAVALIPALSEAMTKSGRPAMWEMFCKIANLAFVLTAGLALLVVIFAVPLVKNVIAPGFTPEKQLLTAQLMRMYLLATLLFTMSGLVTAGLQANQHFFLPALAPLLYNIGQIFGVLVLAPKVGMQIGPVLLPAFGLGIYGLTYGAVIGAAFHLLIQVPGLIKYKFRWTPRISVTDPEVVKVLKLIGPRLVTVWFIQMVFIARDNLASRLGEGPVSALTYGYMLQQVPETLIGTALGVALLPTLAELAAKNEREELRATLERVVKVLLALTLPIAAVLSVGLGPLTARVFGLDVANNTLLMWATRGFMVGLAGHSLKEVAARSFYAQQRVIPPVFTALMTLIIFWTSGWFLMNWLGAPGIGLADSLAFTIEAVVLLVLMSRGFSRPVKINSTLLRGVLAAVAGAGAAYLVLNFLPGGQLVIGLASLTAGALAAVPFIIPEIKLLVRL